MKNHTELIAQAGRQLGEDFRRIREDRNMTLDDLHESTLITTGLLSSFERTALFDHSLFSHVYLRHLVRAYAQAVSISPELALDALEEARRGLYGGRLAAEYLGEAMAPLPSEIEEAKRKQRSERWFSTRRQHTDHVARLPDQSAQPAAPH